MQLFPSNLLILIRDRERCLKIILKKFFEFEAVRCKNDKSLNDKKNVS